MEPKEMQEQLIERLAQNCWDRLVMNDGCDQFFNLFAAAVRDTWREHVGEDVHEQYDDRQDEEFEGLVNEARSALGQALQVVLKDVYPKLLAHHEKRLKEAKT